MRSLYSFLRILAFVVLICLGVSISAQAAPANMERRSDGIKAEFESGELLIQVISPVVVHMAFSRQASFFERTSIDRVPLLPEIAQLTIATSPADFALSKTRLLVIVDRKTGVVSFADASGLVCGHAAQPYFPCGAGNKEASARVFIHARFRVERSLHGRRGSREAQLNRQRCA